METGELKQRDRARDASGRSVLRYTAEAWPSGLRKPPAAGRVSAGASLAARSASAPICPLFFNGVEHGRMKKLDEKKDGGHRAMDREQQWVLGLYDRTLAVQRSRHRRALEGEEGRLLKRPPPFELTMPSPYPSYGAYLTDSPAMAWKRLNVPQHIVDLMCSMENRKQRAAWNKWRSFAKDAAELIGLAGDQQQQKRGAGNDAARARLGGKQMRQIDAARAAAEARLAREVDASGAADFDYVPTATDDVDVRWGAVPAYPWDGRLV